MVKQTNSHLKSKSSIYILLCLSVKTTSSGTCIIKLVYKTLFKLPQVLKILIIYLFYQFRVLKNNLLSN